MSKRQVYAQTWVGKSCPRMHRVIMAQTGDIRGKQIDHKDRNGLNNQRSNLRICSPSENGMNQAAQERNKTSIYKGVTKQSENKWYCRVKKNRKTVFMHMFECERYAAIAYDIKGKELFKDFLRANILDASDEELTEVQSILSNPKKEKGTTSKFLGVFLSKKARWGYNARDNVTKKNYMKQGFATEIEAAQARDLFIKENNLPITLCLK